MPILKVDEKEIEVPQGTTVIEAAKKAGVFIPHYCYHPGLSIAGNCRMCLVEIEKAPKLQISCNTPVAEGMVVHTKNERVKNAQQAVLEFLLINHPLDCPVCDQSGECELQNYYMNYGLYESRLMENKVKKPKAVPVGPTVMLDAERCVLCSRCVRFCDEITGTNELGIINRGDHTEITIAPDTELNNKYSGNVVDICPVGALTDRDFRFKCRVWFLETSPSVCPGCSMGCNIEIHWNKQRPYQTPEERVMRIKPRFNEAVNKWWVCDEGRYGYHFIDKDRILRPIKKVDGRLLQETSWDEAIEQVALLLSQSKGAGVIASTNLTNEDLWVVKEIFEKHLPVQTMAYAWTKKPGYQDQFLIKSDKSPNTRGAQALGFQDKAQEIFSTALKGQIKTLILFGHNLIELLGKDTADQIRSNVENIIIIGSNRHEGLSLSNWVLPSTVYAEKDGTFTNVQGRVQRIFRTFASLGEAREEWEILKMLGQKMGFKLDFQNSRAIFQAIAQVTPQFQGMSYEKLGSIGLTLNEEKMDPVGAHVG